MIPILYESTETAFTSNGICRLRDMISCKVTEERNGIFECDFEYPVDGANFDEIYPGRIIGVFHDDTETIQPFDIVSYSKPIDGVASFHAVHISYRQSFFTVYGSNINSLADALDLLANATPTNPFTYSTDFTSSAYMGAADGIPRTVRQMLGGVEGSILDAYGGEYEFDKFSVILHKNRGETRDFTVRYGVNMLDYQDDADYFGSFSSCIPYWTGEGETVIGSQVDSGLTTYNGSDLCVPLDLSGKFETAPSTSDLEDAALSYMTANSVNTPAQTIKVDFVRLQDFAGYEDFEELLKCNLCDYISVSFPKYGMTGTYKIVKTVYDVLENRYDEMELGALSTSLAEALGVSSSTSGGSSIDGSAFVHIAGEETITGTKTFTNAAVIERSDSGAILELSSAASNTNFLLTRTGGSQCVLESGTSVGLFGTKSNHPLQVRTNYTNRMTFGTDGSVKLVTAPGSSDSSLQLATTAWVRARLAPTFVTFTPSSGSALSSGTNYYAKAGNVVCVNLAITGLSTNSSVTVLTLPSGYRPKYKVVAPVQAGARSDFCTVEISTAGAVTIATHASKTEAIGLISFFVE